jgi:spore germination cell wall hydrolase CwlJ-like protein
LLAALVFGEARGEGWTGQIAVAAVATERARRGGWFGTGLHGVILRDTTGDGIPDQFSCFRPATMGGQLEKLSHPLDHDPQEVWVSCFHAAVAVRFGYVRSSMPGADHYHTVDIEPSWTQRLTRLGVVGRHVFWRTPIVAPPVTTPV